MAGTYREGTVSVTNSISTVSGSGTSWLSNISVNDLFRVDGTPYHVASIVSDTQLTLSAPFGGTTASGILYEITRDFAANGTPIPQRGDRLPWAVTSEALSGLDALFDLAKILDDATDSALVTTGSAGAYAVTTSRNAPPVDGTTFEAKANHASLGASTLVYNGLAAANLLDHKGAALGANALIIGPRYRFRYDGAAWRVMNAEATTVNAGMMSAADKKAHDLLVSQPPKNWIVDGNFEDWQEGVSFTNIFGYTATMWKMSKGVSGAATVSQQSFALGQTDVPGQPQFFLRHDRTGANSAADQVLFQELEGVKTLAGRTASVVFWGKVTSGTKTFVSRQTQNFGTGGAPSGAFAFNSDPFTLTTSWQRFTIVINIPSIAGKTIGTNNNDFLRIALFELTGFSTFTVDIANVWLVEGDATIMPDAAFFTTPEQRAADATQIEAVYEKSYVAATPPGTSTNANILILTSRAFDATNTYFTHHNFRRRKTRTPSVSIWSGNGTAGNIQLNSVGAVTGVAGTIEIINTDRFSARAIGTASGLTAGDAVTHAFHFRADSRL